MRKFISIVSSIFLMASQSWCVTNNKINYDTGGQAITIAGGGTSGLLTGATTYISNSIDNTSNLYIDVFVVCTASSAASGVSSNGQITMYAYGTANSAGNSNFTDGVSGSSSVYTGSAGIAALPPSMPTVVVSSMGALSRPYVFGGSIAKAFGFVPAKFGIALNNNSGATTTAGSCFYQGIWIQNL